MPPVLALAPGVAIVVKAPPLSERWMVKPVSLVALSVKLTATCGPACRVAVRPSRRGRDSRDARVNVFDHAEAAAPLSARTR